MGADRDPLLQLERLAAVFKPGQTALGHHWNLFDGDEAEVGRTKLFYEGSGKTMGRLMRVTGLSTTGTLHAHVLDAAGNERYVIHSFPGKEKHVELLDAGGEMIGQARRAELSLELLGPGGDVVVGRIDRADKEDMAFGVLDAAGRRVAVLTKQKLETSAPSIGAMIFMPDIASNQIAFQATMHLGFAGSREYHLLVEQRPTSEPLATMVALSPLIAAYAY